jgi:hypothetical protein
MKKTVIELSVVVLGGLILLGLVYYKKQEAPHENAIAALESQMCPTDVMMCPDGTSVARSGTNCEFGVCKQELPSYLQKTNSQTTRKQDPSSDGVEASIPSTTIFSKAKKSVTTIVEEIAARVTGNSAPSTQSSHPSSNTQSTSQSSHPSPSNPSSPLSEVRYNVTATGTIIGSNGDPIYTIPPQAPAPGGGMETHPVNVVPVNNVAPVIGAIPITGLPGKYYLSENSFGTQGGCVFSNKIYILDTNTGEKILMYEENNSTITEEDPRACSSEMYLLATENEKLILKYHTIGTNMTCDSTWSEPDKTWYLDVTHLELSTRRYPISTERYEAAERDEETCRTNYENPTTSNGIGG